MGVEECLEGQEDQQLYRLVLPQPLLLCAPKTRAALFGVAHWRVLLVPPQEPLDPLHKELLGHDVD